MRESGTVSTNKRCFIAVTRHLCCAHVPVNVEQDPEKPGHYVVSFKPPDGVRDGKIHNVEVRVKKRRLNASFKFSIPIQKLPTVSRE